jgi:paraquat-inducible protein B
VARRASPALIGAFVLGAIALAVIGITMFGSGKLFRKTTTFVMYFPGSVDGLNVGAPVKFKGVEIGSVTQIRINLGQYRTQDARIPVFVEIDNARATQQGAETNADYVHTLIHDRGLRAQLQPQSLLTGLLFVQLDLFPDTPIVTMLPSDAPYREIPTIPTTLAQVEQTITRILAKLEKADVEGLLATAREALEGIRGVATSPELRRFEAGLPGTLANVDQTVTSIRQLATNLDGETGPLIAGLRQAATQADGTLLEWKGTARRLNGALEPDSALRNQLTTALDELTGAARSVRLLADFLERNPSAVLRGRAASNR